MFSKLLNQKQTSLIKGVAITLIVIHNFLHRIYSTGESEFTFESGRIFNVLGLIANSPSSFINILFSYLGHYGVQLFVFCSGYGLAIQYSKNPTIRYFRFLTPKLLKLYSLILAGILFYLALNFNKITNYRLFFLWAGLLFTGLTNLSFYTLFGFVGPWWYFSLAIQLYLVFPILYKLIFKYEKKIILLFLFIIYVLIYLLYPIAQNNNVPLFGIFIGHLPEFILAICMVCFNNWKINKWIFLFSIVFFIASNFTIYLFPFSFLSATIILLYFCYYISKLTYLNRFFTYIGSLSMFIFIINGPIRGFTIPLLKNDNHFHMFCGAIIHFFIVILVSLLVSFIYKKTFQPTLKFLLKKLYPTSTNSTN